MRPLRRLPEFLIALSAIPFGAAVTAYVTTTTISYAVIASALIGITLFGLGMILSLDSVRRRLPFLRTTRLRLLTLHDSLQDAREQLKVARQIGTFDRSLWVGRVTALEGDYRETLENEVPEHWRGIERKHSKVVEHLHSEWDDHRWADHALELLLERLNVLAGLLAAMG